MDREDIVVIDTETNSLRKPSKVHVICTRTFAGETREFLDVLKNPEPFIEYVKPFPKKVGHNFIQYDLRVALDRLVPSHGITFDSVLDTLVLSRLLNYSIPGGHSLKVWGERFGIKKIGADIEEWEEFDPLMIERCHSDTLINLKILDKYWKYVTDPTWQAAIDVEHFTASVCSDMTENGFPFAKEEAEKHHARISGILKPIDDGIAMAFPPRSSLVREVNPRVTRSGAFNLTDFKWFKGDDLSPFSEGAPFSVIEWEPFNTASPKQVVERLNEAGWKPTEKTKGHTDFLKQRGKRDPEKAAKYAVYGWKISEENLKTLPDTAPEAAKNLGKRIILQSRLSDLEEWLALAEPEGDGWNVHGSFSPIGAWTQRLSHSKPNLANVPVAKRSPKDTEFQRLVNDLNDDMRSLWTARPGFRLLGTDADGIQMRIFAHIVNDKELVHALVEGKKEDETDIHSLHKRKLGDSAKSRDASKTFIYAWLLGAGNGKVAEILETTPAMAKNAVERFVSSYPGLAELKRSQIPRDAKRGYFEGLDGRKVVCDSEHLMLAGYLQNGEAIIMKGACRDWTRELRKLGIPFWLRTWPHDEWQTEVPDDDAIAKIVSDIQIQAIRNQGPILGMNLPLEGTTTIQKNHPPYPDGFIGGYTWRDTH